MIAERAATAATTLLYEPVLPFRTGDADAPGGWRPGWARRDGLWVRRYRDDEMGAVVQHTVARYYLTNIGRADLAEELGYSERQIQGFVSGTAWTGYTAPVLAALQRLGISRTRGNWNSSGHSNRAGEMVRAQADVLRRCQLVVDGAHVTPTFLEELRSDLRLLAFATS